MCNCGKNQVCQCNQTQNMEKKPMTKWGEKKTTMSVISNISLGMIIPAFVLFIGDRNWMSELSASIFIINLWNYLQFFDWKMSDTERQEKYKKCINTHWQIHLWSRVAGYATAIASIWM